jgi:D-alanyl-lipoteichoic acid acyltransferase DltB (MBOAT superfamily)
MKLVIADRIAPSIDSVLNNVSDASGIQLLTATLLYPIQLYADFAGYTNMAIGLGTMFGFSLSPNFNRPFASLSTGELWRRWHISLSSWVRDYVYMPLSAETRHWKRHGIYFSIIVTFVVIGVWHGAGWTFAIYGLIQGLIIIYETAATDFRKTVRSHCAPWLYQSVMIVRTYILFALSLLFFRVARMSDVMYVYRHLFDGFNSSIKELRLGMTDTQWIVFGIAVVFMLTTEYINSRHDIISWTAKRNTWQRWTIYFGIMLLIFLCGAFGVENFIYIQF